MFWADEIAEKIIQTSPDKDLYRVHDYKTPSGRIHVGALCGVIIHGVVARALENKGKKVSFVYGFDDYDPMDGFPIYLPEEFRQYMGKPLSEIPSPEEGFENFGQYYAQEFIEIFNRLGFEPEIIWASQMYKTGKYNDAIKISLDKADIIRKIYKEVSGSIKPVDWYGLSVVCPKCEKIGTTRVFAWDGQQVSFKCEPEMVEWAEGCGYESKISPYDGNAKLPWKVEWAAKWFMFNEDFETAGKDHMTKGGSIDVSQTIAREVFNANPPVGRQFPYEWILIEGKKMSSSKGVGASAKEVSEMLPTHLLTFFIAKSKINRHKEFSPNGATMPLLYDEFDKAITAFHSDKESDLAKVIEYIKPRDWHVPSYIMRFSKVVFLSQMPNVDIWQVAKEEKGSELLPEDRSDLQERIDYSKHWLRDFAPEEMKYELQESLPDISLSENQINYLKQLVIKLENNNWEDGEELHKLVHDTKNELNIIPKEAFSSIYQIFLNRDSGPQAGWFLKALGKDFVINRLKEASAQRSSND